MTSKEFKQWLKDHKLTYVRAAKVLGVSCITVKRYATGKRYQTGGGWEPVKIPKIVGLLCKLIPRK